MNERGTPLSLATLPLDDPTYELLSRAETQGVFQLESSGMRDALRKLKPDCFEDIIAMVSLYRPGPMDNIPRYTNVKHGLEDPSYLHPLLEPILAETNGVIIYQEQVMEIAKQLAGYTLGGADLLRRAMGKKIKAEMDAQREVFVEGAVERGIGAKLADTIFDAVAKFASYGFNKSHAAAYALLAYQTGLAQGEPPGRVLRRRDDHGVRNQEKLAAYRKEMRQRGIPLYPPDVNASARASSSRTAGGRRRALRAGRDQGRGCRGDDAPGRGAGGARALQGPLRPRPGWARRCSTSGCWRAWPAPARSIAGGNRRRLVEAADLLLRYAAARPSGRERAGEPVRRQRRRRCRSRRCRPARTGRRSSGCRWSSTCWACISRPTRSTATGRAGAPGRHAARPAAAGRGEGGRLRLAGVVASKQERVTERTRFVRLIVSDHTAQFEVTVFSELMGQARELLDGTGAALLRGRRPGRRRQSPPDRAANPEARRGRRPGAAAVEIQVAAPAAALKLKTMLQRRAPTGPGAAGRPLPGRCGGGDYSPCRDFLLGQRPAA